MSIYERAFQARGRLAASDRGERRGFKIPVLSKLRIGGSVGKAAEAVKAHVPSIPGMVLGPAGSLLNGSLQEDLTKGAKNVPLVLGGIGALGGAAGGIGGAVSSAAGALTGGGSGGGAGNLLDLGLGGLSAYNAAKLGQKSEQFATDANDMAQANWKSREPLRLAGVEGMLHPTPSSDLSGLNQVAARNPYAPKPKPPLVMGGA